MIYLKSYNKINELNFNFFKNNNKLIIPIIINNKTYDYRLIKLRSNMHGDKWFFNLSGNKGEITIKYDINNNIFKIVRICHLTKNIPKLTDNSKEILLNYINNKNIIDYIPFDNDWIWV